MTDIKSQLIPEPKEILSGKGSFKWTDSISILVEPESGNGIFATETLLDACRERALPAPGILGADSIKEATKPLILAGDPCRHLPLLQAMREENLFIFPEMADEGYILHITPSRILIIGNTSAGIYYGFQTLIQLLPQTQNAPAEIPALTIKDWPSLRQRGVSVDIARGEVCTPEALKDHIRRLAHYKINFMALYIENAFLFPSHPDIGKDRDRLTTKQARDIDEWAKKHHVMVVPSIDSPGHMERFLADPNYAHLAEGTENFHQSAVINTTHPDAYSFLRDLYTDISKAFSAPFHFVCGDEAFGLGRGKSKPEADAFGLGNLHVRHIKRIRDMFAEMGKRILIAGDPFEPDFFKSFGLENYGMDALRQIPRDCVVVPWHYNRMDEFPVGDEIAALGFDQQLWAWQGDCNGIFPDIDVAMENITTYVPHAHRLKALGAVCSSWGDRNSFREYNWPTIVFYSDWAWRNPGRSENDLLPLAVERLFGPGTAPLAEAIKFLGHPNRYFGWALEGLGSSGFLMFYNPMEPCKLDKEKLRLLEQFRQDAAAARSAYEEAREQATFLTEFMDYFDFALYQFEVMADLVECRHLMAQKDEDSREELEELLEEVADSLADLRERYHTLWHRTRLPKGLDPNDKNFEVLEKSILDALGKMGE